jgi:predicted enzyme related to lactoylglutathione lyase
VVSRQERIVQSEQLVLGKALETGCQRSEHALKAKLVPVVHFEIIGGKEKQLERFYRELFGWKINSNNPLNYGLVDTGGGPGAINGGVAANQEGVNRVSVYVRVDNLQASLDKAEKLGGKTILTPTEVPGGPKLALFSDQAGNVTGLILEEQ